MILNEAVIEKLKECEVNESGISSHWDQMLRGFEMKMENSPEKDSQKEKVEMTKL